jgi:hypothetical protein
MTSDVQARDAVLQLMKRFDSINAQRLSIAYVLAEKDAAEYAKLLTTAEKAEKKVIEPQIGSEHANVYAALTDPNADWPKAIIEMLDTRPIIKINSK